MGKIVEVCISEKRGTQKHRVGKALFFTDHGMVGDAHAGHWHRQVSLLSAEAIEAFKARGAKVQPGAFGENLVVSGFDLKLLPIGTRLRSGEVLMEVTQIGKTCYEACEIGRIMGDCIMPREGIFARVLHGGWISKGDAVEIDEAAEPLDAAVLTLSDKASRGERQDTSGPKASALLQAAGYEIADYSILPDRLEKIRHKLEELSDLGVALIVTTGGTGFSRTDCTPEATIAVCDRLAPGIPEAMRAFSMQITRRAMLSRAAAGIRKRTLIVNLPGSPKAVEECLGFILPELQHGIAILKGMAGECARG